MKKKAQIRWFARFPAIASAKEAFLIVLVAISLHGCRSAARVLDTPFADDALAHALRQKMENRYPPCFSAIHRVLLSAGRRQFDLNGYLAVQRPAGVKLVATSDLGGTAFEIEYVQGADVRITKNSAGLRRPWLEMGAARDAFIIYLATPSPQAILIRRDDVIGLAEDRTDGTREEFLFDEATHRLVGYNISSGGRSVYEAVFSSDGMLPQWDRPVPLIIKIRDRALGYQLTVRVLELRPLQSCDGEVTGGSADAK